MVKRYCTVFNWKSSSTKHLMTQMHYL